MPPSEAKSKKKKVKKTVRMEDEQHRTLAKLGALPPADEDEPVRDVDVFSEAPEIDTTWSERPPRRSYCCYSGLFCVCVPILVLAVVLTTFEVLFVGHRSVCSVYEVLTRLSRLNSSEIEAGISNMYTECKV